MNKKDILELKRRFKKDACTFTRLCGCYVDADHNKVTSFGETFLNLEDEEFYKYLEIAKKVMSGTIGNNLLELEFPTAEEAAGGRQQFLMGLRESALKNDDLMEAFYDLDINSNDYVGKYLADRVIRVIIFTVLFTVFYASLHIVIVWLNLLSRLPIIYGLNKIAGAVLGLTEALIFVWIGCLVLTLFSGSPIGKSMIDQINGSIWLTWLYDHNMLSYLVVGLVRSVL